MQQNSPCIDAGVFLTKTTSAGSGNDIPVEDAGYFCDGWRVVVGDMIKIGSHPSIQIVAIDYSQNLMTINQSINWQAGEPVSLNYLGSTPDIGAIEFHQQGDAFAPNPPQNIKVSTSQSDSSN